MESERDGHTNWRGKGKETRKWNLKGMGTLIGEERGRDQEMESERDGHTNWRGKGKETRKWNLKGMGRC